MEKKKKILLAILIPVIIISLIIGICFAVKSSKDKPTNEVTTEQTTENVEVINKPDYSEYIAKNKDTVGYISIPDTNISFPVVQTDNNNFYLKHDFDKKSSKNGTVYMDYRCNAKDLYSNTVIYGHNTYDGDIFSDLSNYDDIDYYNRHPIIEFNTLDHYYKWKICGVFITNQIASEDNGYIFNFVYPHNLEDINFDGYINEFNKRTLYHTDVDIQKGDKILTLSSCVRNLDLPTYRAKTSIVIIARMVREGEDEYVDTTKATVNENPKYPQLYYDKYKKTNPYKNDKKWYPKDY